MNYELVLLDADGTLLDFEAASEAAFAATLGALLPGLAEPALADLYRRYHRINQTIWLELERGEIDKESLKTERFGRFLRELGREGPAEVSEALRAAKPEAEGLGRDYLSALAREAPLLPGALDFVRRLNEAGCRPHIATNGVARVQRGRFALSPLGPLVGELLISEELGAEKPAPAFFAAAFGRLGEGARKGRAVMVGDSWGADVEGALGAGLEAVWFNPEGRDAPRIAPGVREAGDYAELLAILGVN